MALQKNKSSCARFRTMTFLVSKTYIKHGKAMVLMVISNLISNKLAPGLLLILYYKLRDRSYSD